MQHIPHIGERFGLLTVLSVCEDKRYRDVQCDCGTKTRVLMSNMKRGLSKSCGCVRSGKPAVNFVCLAGQKFNMLTVLERAQSSRKKITKWRCHCDCGNEVVVLGAHIKSGHTKSCGCKAREMLIQRATTHAKSKTKAYRVWTAMMRRCYNKNCTPYKWYGARGIKVHERWHKFVNFHADMGDPPDGKELDRKNNDGNYSKENCRWITHKENCNNRRKRASNESIY